MNLRFAAVLLLALAAPAMAQVTNICGEQVAALNGRLVPITEQTCMPIPKSAGGWAENITQSGTMLYHYCPTMDGNWTVVMTVADPNAATVEFWRQLSADMAVAAASSDPEKAVYLEVKKRLTLPMDDPRLTAVWCPRRAEMVANMPASQDNASTPPAVYLIDSTKARWTIGADGYAYKAGKKQSRKATELFYRLGSIYLWSPTDGYWYRYVGGSWIKQTKARP